MTNIEDLEDRLIGLERLVLDMAKAVSELNKERIQRQVREIEELYHQSSITITSPDDFEDDEECGYCQRPIGEPHKGWCRQ